MRLFISKLEDLLLTIAQFGSSARYFAQTADFACKMKPESGRVKSGRVESLIRSCRITNQAMVNQAMSNQAISIKTCRIRTCRIRTCRIRSCRIVESHHSCRGICTLDRVE